MLLLGLLIASLMTSVGLFLLVRKPLTTALLSAIVHHFRLEPDCSRLDKIFTHILPMILPVNMWCVRRPNHSECAADKDG